MKLRPLLTVALVAGITLGVIWLFNKPAPVEPAKVADAPKPVAPKLTVAAPKMQVAAPTAAPVPKSSTPAPPAPIVSTGPTTAAQAAIELNATFDDMATMIQSGNMVGLMETYAPPDEQARLTPEMKAQMEQQMAQEMARPEAQQQIQMMVTVLQGLKTQTPTMNDAGDKATYQFSPTPDMVPPGADLANMPASIPISFTKQNGKWYINQGGF